MYIAPVINNYNFGRAFTTKEKEQYHSLLNDTKQELGIKDTTAIVFDFNVPSEKGYNTGIGTTFSESMKDFTEFLASVAGINSIQLQPQGKITRSNTSPYSGTNYAFGEHIIDLKKLASKEYGELLSLDDIKKTDDAYKGDKELREYRTDYEYVLGAEKEDGIQQKLLYKAYCTFNKGIKNNLSSVTALGGEFSKFKTDNSDWLEKNAMYELLSKQYKTSDFRNWDEPDNLLYSDKTSNDVRQNRLEELKNNNKEFIEFENFKQFIASKQQAETRQFLNSEDIKLYGDCLIGFSQGEMWSNIDCFRDNLYYGGPDPNCKETNEIQTWGLPALDYTLLGKCEKIGDISELGKTGKLLYDKYLNFFKRYDGIRMDAAWQFVTPFIYKEENGNYEAIEQPELNETIFNIMKTASENAGTKANLDNESIMLELVGLSAGRSRELTLNKYPHLYTTAYAEYDECPEKFLEKGYKQGMFYVGVGCHDNDSLINMAKDTYKRELHTQGIKRDYDFDFDKLSYNAEEYNSQKSEEKTLENYRNAKLSEIFTSAKQFITLPDMFGMQERINISGEISKDNWSIRIPNNYEKFYHSQLAKGFGLNLPKVLAGALYMKKSTNNHLIEKCNEAAEILRSSGPMTEEAANIEDRNGHLSNKFQYIA
ncbi:4-alpha-glucanotransferase [bacterium]|nr:4-alpha-glucanotransferase [bacterium]